MRETPIVTKTLPDFSNNKLTIAWTKEYPIYFTDLGLCGNRLLIAKSFFRVSGPKPEDDETQAASLLVLNPDTGEQLSEIIIGKGELDNLTEIDEDNVAFVQTNREERTARLVCVNLSARKVTWVSEESVRPYTMIRLAKQGILVCYSRSSLVGINTQNGRTLWSAPTDMQSMSFGVHPKIGVLHRNKEGRLQCHDAATGKFRWLTLLTKLSDLILINDRIVFYDGEKPVVIQAQEGKFVGPLLKDPSLLKSPYEYLLLEGNPQGQVLLGTDSMTSLVDQEGKLVWKSKERYWDIQMGQTQALGAQDKQLALIDLKSGRQLRQVKLNIDFNIPVVSPSGVVYLFSTYGMVTCLK